MQQMPNMAAMAGEQPQAQQKQIIQPQAVQGAMNAQKPEAQVQVLVQKMMQVLQETGYFDLPENTPYLTKFRYNYKRNKVEKRLNRIIELLKKNDYNFKTFSQV